MNNLLSRPEIYDLDDGTELLVKWWSRPKPKYYILVKQHCGLWVLPIKLPDGFKMKPIPLDLTRVTINGQLKETTVSLSDRPFITIEHHFPNVLIPRSAK